MRRHRGGAMRGSFAKKRSERNGSDQSRPGGPGSAAMAVDVRPFPSPSAPAQPRFLHHRLEPPIRSIRQRHQQFRRPYHSRGAKFAFTPRLSPVELTGRPLRRHRISKRSKFPQEFARRSWRELILSRTAEVLVRRRLAAPSKPCGLTAGLFAARRVLAEIAWRAWAMQPLGAALRRITGPRERRARHSR